MPTTRGDVFFKALPPALAFESALTVALGQRRPDSVPEVVAIETERRWMLMRDAGPQLREQPAGSEDPGIWDELLPLYAQLQIDVAGSVAEILDLGTPDERSAHLCRRLDDLLGHWEVAPEPVSLRRMIEERVSRLADTIPSSIVHEEFNDNNIHLRGESPVILDWGEAVVGHPFTGLVVTMRVLVDRWGFEPGGPELVRFRDLYLEPWTSFAPLPELVDLFTTAQPLGMVMRALAWDRILAPLEAADRAEFDHIVPAWLNVMRETLEGTATLGT